MNKSIKKWLSLALALALALSLSVTAFAAPASGNVPGGGDINASQEQTAKGYTYTAPTSPMAVDPGIITATAHRAASPVLGMMGLNATSGFGMINGNAPADLADAETRFALGVWGTSLNDKPDPYYWNYFYNFYAEANGLEKSADALINANVAASPVGADTNLQEEYGNVSYSLATRPEIVIGVASTNGGSDTHGYDAQLETIHSFAKDSPYYQEGDENYDPQLVSYQTTYLKQMIESVYRVADAIDAVKAETGKTTRYGDAQQIAKDYEKYVYGLIAYVHEELAAKGLPQKTVAVVTAINEDGTYTLADSVSRSATSLVRAYEYTMSVSESLVDKIGGTTATLDQLLSADAIVTINNNNITTAQMLESFGDKTYDGILVASQPAAMYGITMNSVENAMGNAYVVGSIYSDILDLDPVELCAYFYYNFLHVTNLDGVQTIVNTNFANTILPEGVSTTLAGGYLDKVKGQLDKGEQYFQSHVSEFQNAACENIGIAVWHSALAVYSQKDTESSYSLVKSYTAADLAALAQTNTYAYPYYQRGAAKAVVATEYVTLDALLTDAGVTFADGDTLNFYTTDDGGSLYQKWQPSYADVKNGVDFDGSLVPTGIALKWGNGDVDTAAVASSVANIAAGARATEYPRFIIGAPADDPTSAMGFRLVTSVIGINVIQYTDDSASAQPTNQKLTIDGAEKTTEIYNIGGYNYFKLRDMAALLKDTDVKFDVGYDETTRTVTVTKGEAYVPQEGDLTTGTDKSASCVVSNQAVKIDGKDASLKAYNLGDNNFFRLRDLGAALGFNVSYDEATRTMVVTTVAQTSGGQGQGGGRG